MAVSLENTLWDVLNSRIKSYRVLKIEENDPFRKFFMRVPYSLERTELPLFAVDPFLRTFPKEVENLDTLPGEVSIRLKSSHRQPDVTTLGSIINKVLSYSPSYNRNGLLVIKPKNESIPYYSDYGSIFNEFGYPIMIITVVFKTKVEEVSESKVLHFSPTKVLIRLARSCFDRDDYMQRFLSGKFLSTASQFKSCSFRFGSQYYSLPVEVLIAENHFLFQAPKSPKLTTDTQELLQVVSRHINDIYNP